MPRYLGQHFLQNEAVVKKIIAAIDPRTGETIIEVGSGRGALTIPLAIVCARTGAKLIAVEKDERLANALRKNPALALDDVEIVHDDILMFLKHAHPEKIVGNIPYYLTGYLLRAIGTLALDSKVAGPHRAVFMVQKEVAERICAVPPRMNRLAASVQFWAESKILARVPRSDFSPPPEVDSVVIVLENRNGAERIAATAQQYDDAIRSIFAQPRKTLINNLVSGGIERKIAADLLIRLDIPEKSRPQDLSVEKIAALAAAMPASSLTK